MDIALLLLRIVIGLLFVGHGSQKLFGWFEGHGIEGTAQFFGQLGFTPPKFWATVAGLAEFLGGIGLALGLFTPIAAAAIIGTMLMAIIKVHWDSGIWNSEGGLEYPLANMIVAGFIGYVGAGQYALDAALNIAYPMPITFFVATGIAILGVVAGLASAEMGQQQMGEASGA